MDALQRHGVDTIFGYPGGAILPIYDSLHIAESEGWVKHILVRHEQAGTVLLSGGMGGFLTTNLADNRCPLLIVLHAAGGFVLPGSPHAGGFSVDGKLELRVIQLTGAI